MPRAIQGRARKRLRALLPAVVVIFLIVNLVNALKKDSDFDVYLDAARHVVAGVSPYIGSTVAAGFVGPPVQATLFVPFVPLAALHPMAARIAWYVVNVLLLWLGLTAWLRALDGDESDSTPTTGWDRIARPEALLAILGIAYPLQTQFENQNLNIVLLALTGTAALSLRRGRGTFAGLAIGAAAALKVYPALALPWLAARRSWRALAVATAAAIVMTILPMAVRGPSDFTANFARWRAIAGEGWPSRRANQAIVAMWGRYLRVDGPDGYPTITFADRDVVALTAVTTAVLMLPLVAAAIGRVSPRSTVEQFACVSAVAAVISPIAWEHYWVAWFPVLVVLLQHARRDRSRWALAAFCAGALLITGLSRPFVGWNGARVVRAWSLMTWGGLITCSVLSMLLLHAAWARRGRSVRLFSGDSAAGGRREG